MMRRVKKSIKIDMFSDTALLDSQMSFGLILKVVAKFMLVVKLRLLIWRFSIPMEYDIS